MSLRYQNLAKLVWDNAELLRGHYKAEEYGSVITPMFMLRRIECLIEETRKEVADACEENRQARELDPSIKPLRDMQIERIAGGRRLWNRTTITVGEIGSQNDEADAARMLTKLLEEADPHTLAIWEQTGFHEQVKRLAKADLIRKLARIFHRYDLHDRGKDTPEEDLGQQAMGTVFEDLLKLGDKGFTDGDHFTPREVVKLNIALILAGDPTMGRRGAIRSVYDGTCGSAGMLIYAWKGIKAANRSAEITLQGQDINPFSAAMARADLTAHDIDGEIEQADTFTDDRFKGLKVSYVASNPPFGVNWLTAEKEIRSEHEAGGGRFDAGLPPISDGSLLFLQHNLSKLQEPIHPTREKPEGRPGGRMGIILSGSPLFSGGPGSGESEIRRMLIEKDLLEAIVMLPGDLFANTGIQTYIWLISNDKAQMRQGKVQIIDAREFGHKLRRNQKSKRWEMTTPEILGPDDRPLGEDSDTSRIRRVYEAFDQASRNISVVVPGKSFGFRRITVEQPLRLKIGTGNLQELLLETGLPMQAAGYIGSLAEQAREAGDPPSRFSKIISRELKALGLKPKDLTTIERTIYERDPNGEVQLGKDGKPLPDLELRDTEDVPLDENVEAYMAREVLPHTPDAWVSEDPKHCEEVPEGYSGERRGKVGYEFKLGKLFPKPKTGRPLAQVEQELRSEIIKMQAALKPLLKELGLEDKA